MFQELVSRFLELKIWQIAGLLVGSWLAFELLQGFFYAIYNLFFHPLRHFPSSNWDIGFALGRYWRIMRGTASQHACDRHAQYGDVVRTGANVLSYCSAQAWKDIYGSANDLPKFILPGSGLPDNSILVAARGDHGRQRRLMAPAFTEKSLVQQEQLIRVYVDLLVQRLQETHGSPTNAVKWFNLTTFDLIGDLAFGQSLQGLEANKSNQWLDNINKSFRFIPFFVLMRLSSTLAFFISLTIGRKIQAAKDSQMANITALVHERQTKDDRGDFMDYLIGKLPEHELVGNANLFMLAGSHTSATLLSGLAYWLSRTPHAYNKVVTEIREAFNDGNQITFSACEKLPYLRAVVDEALRMFPPIPLALNRITTAPTMICGQMVPADTILGVHHLAAAQSDRNFHRSKEFVPERWLEKDNPKSPFHDDKRDAFQPFSYGPRNCVGQKLAGHEIRLIVSKVLWNFDLELEPECLNWKEQPIMASWALPPLMMRFANRMKSEKA